MSKTAKIFALILLTAIVAAGAFVAAFPARNIVALAGPAGVQGSGASVDDPYIISDSSDWLSVAVYLNSSSPKNEYFKLSDDIDMSGVSFMTLGDSDHPFVGKFDGGGKTIKNISYPGGNYAAVFPYVGPAGEIKNFGVYGGSISGGNYVGGIAGYNAGYIHSCFNTASVSATGSYAGGIAGYSRGKIINSYNTGNITSAGGADSYAGGVLGYILEDPESGVAGLAYTYSLGNVISNGYKGGVLGGRSPALPLVRQSFYSTDFFKNGFAIGRYAAGNGDPGDLNSGGASANRVAGMLNRDINGQTINTLRFNEPEALSEWKEINYTTGSDYAAYFAPALKTFSPNNNSSDTSYKTIIIRLYGIEGESSSNWGSEANPFIISTPAHLLNLLSAVNNNAASYYGKYFKMSADINLAGTGFVPIGDWNPPANRSQPFSGVFDGNNHTIQNMVLSPVTTDAAADYLGMFKYLDSNSTVKNLYFDSGCSVSGRNYVGTLAGYCMGRVINVESRAAVRGTNSVGGIVGSASGAVFTGVLSATDIQVNPGGVGVNGVVAQAINSSFTNVWYLAHAGGECTSTNQGGRTLYVDINGNVGASKSAAGEITFYKTQAEDGYILNFRTETEAPAAAGDSFVPAPGGSGTIYARFVKMISVIQSPNADIYLLSAANHTVILTEGYGYYYDNQTIDARIKVNTGYFVASAFGYNKFGGTQELANLAYGYDASTSTTFQKTITLVFKSGAILTGLAADVVKIDATGINPRPYDGYPTVYNYAKEGYSAFAFTYNYDTGGTPPTAAGTHSIEIMVRKDGIMRGSESFSFLIEKRLLTIPVSALIKKKEFDNREAGVFIPISLDQNAVAFATGPDGRNFADIDIISGGSAHRVVVGASIAFNSREIGDAKDITYKFTLTGVSAINYQLPDNLTLAGAGEITKRTVVYSVKQNLYRIYDGNVGVINNYETVPGKEGVPDLPVGAVIGFLKNGVPDPARDVGTYTLTIAPGPVYAGYYTVIWDRSEGYTFEVRPRPVLVSFTGATLVYNGEVRTVAGSYQGVQGTVNLSPENFAYEYFDGSAYVPAEFRNAGTYKVTATVAGNYVAIASSGEGGLRLDQTYATINKAQQTGFKIIEPEGPFTYGDQPVALSAGGGQGGGAISFSVVSGFARIDGNTLKLTGGGEITFKAVRAESDNYLAAEDSASITVSKAVLYISLPDSSFAYADRITFGYLFEGYAYEDAGVPSGFTAPSVYLDGEPFDPGRFYPVKDGGYIVTIGGDASSDGYEFDYSYFENRVVFTITRKAVKVVADAAGSVYGEPDSLLTYKVYAVTGGGDVLLTNGEHDIIFALFRRPGADVGPYEIAAGEGSAEENALHLSQAFSNYAINFVAGIYTVSRRPVYLTMVGAFADPASGLKYLRKIYGEPDPVLTAADYIITGLANGDSLASALFGRDGKSIAESLTRVAGENAFSAFDASLPYGYYGYVGSGLQTGPNYRLEFFGINLRIYPAAPAISNTSALQIQYGYPLSSIDLNTALSSSATGSFAWAAPAVIPDFSVESVLTFDARFTSSSKNFLDAVIPVDVAVIPRIVGVSFTGETNLVYTGLERRTVNYSITNALQGDELHAELKYYIGGNEANSVGAAGVYTAIVTISNGNYALGGTTEITVTIHKAPLTIYLEEIYLPEDQTPSKDFKYEGFVNGEDEGVLTSRPDVVFETVPGNYTITPFGAAALNYEISYLPSRQHVTKTHLSSITSNFYMSGNFDNTMDVAVAEVRKSENRIRFTELSEQFDTFKTGDLSKMKVAMVFDVNFTLGDEPGSMSGAATAYFDLPTRLKESKRLAVILVKSDGTFAAAKNVSREGDRLSFEIEDCDYFFVASPPDYTWVYISAVIVVLLVGAFVLDGMSEKGKKRRKRNS
jgi:hypothetical protein